MELKKILIVDDEDDVLKVLEKRLTTAGYAVIKARNGEEAIRLVKSDRPSLILLDINMPGMDGGQVRGVLKSDPMTKDIPVIFLTCLLAKDEEKVLGHERGGDFFIAKPYNVDDLLKQIEEHL
jgi:two-component system alkaline phosphatase synthesis response regulator PhoP